MLFYYIQIKDSHDPGVNIREKARVASINKAEGSSGGGGGGAGGAQRLLARIWGKGEKCPKKTFRS